MRCSIPYHPATTLLHPFKGAHAMPDAIQTLIAEWEAALAEYQCDAYDLDDVETHMGYATQEYLDAFMQEL